VYQLKKRWKMGRIEKLDKAGFLLIFETANF